MYKPLKNISPKLKPSQLWYLCAAGMFVLVIWCKKMIIGTEPASDPENPQNRFKNLELKLGIIKLINYRKTVLNDPV